MSNPPTLLADDGSASMATGLMMSHHAFRRDLGRFRAALEALDESRIPALREEWTNFHGALHGHHESEDTRMFPAMSTQHAVLVPTITKLTADHKQIDPLLERGDRAFAELPNTAPALALVNELAELLAPHLALEEAEVVPFLRDAKQFPPPGNDSEAQMYADGFAWSSDGIATDVLDAIYAICPPAVRQKLPAARAKFQARCDRVWGQCGTTQSRTPVPGR